MLRLENVKIKENTAEADFYPEDSAKAGHIVVDLSTKETISLKNVPGYGDAYEFYARKRLCTLAKEKSDATRSVVMWY
jgi:hypothetical protein